jgi:tRNA-Thr(GGU) m(6)t(6)A37 methyltransferase TsaA
MKKTFELIQIGEIKRDDNQKMIIVDKAYRDLMKRIEDFSHIMVFWWANEGDNEEARNMLTCEPPYAEGIEAGMFACRSPFRPNPIAMTVCPIISVNHERGEIVVSEIDATDGTPLVDIKAYFPVCDRVQNAKYPDWLQGWPEWMPEEGIGLM